MNDIQYFTNQLNTFGLDPTDKQLDDFNRYYDLLIEWNQKMNLTAITEKKDVYIKHFLDSVSIIKAFDLCEVSSMIDVGTGAGFPGIPVKIMFPHIKVTLLDSLQKRVGFLDAVIDKLSLNDIYTIHGRAEDIAHDLEYREQYDVCVSRAVANLSTLSELCLPFVRVGGSFISYKSDKSEEEVRIAENAIRSLGGHITNTVSFDLTGNRRVLIVVCKNTSTSLRFPRKAGIPAKKPII